MLPLACHKYEPTPESCLEPIILVGHEREVINVKKCNTKQSIKKIRKILGPVLIVILLVGSLGVTFMPMKAYASTTITQGNKIVNTNTSETLIYDGYKHESTVYAGVIKRNGETVLNYLFSEDITRSSVVFDNLRKALPNPFSDMVPSVIEEQTKKGLKEMSATAVNNIDLSTVSSDWKEAGSLAAQIYKDKDTSDSTNTLLYDASDECKSYIDDEAKEREKGLDDPIAADKRIISHLGTKTTDNVNFQVVDGQLMEVHDVNLIYLSEATTLIYTTVNVVDKTDSEVTKESEETDGETSGKTDGEGSEGTDGEASGKTDGEGSEGADGEASEKTDENASGKTAKVTKAPSAKKLTYNGKNQKLVVKGTASNGKMYYAVKKNTKAPKDSAYKTSIPTGNAAGTYYVWYKVKGKEGYKDSKAKKIKVTIAGDPFNFNTSFKVTQKDGTIKVTWDKVNGFKKADVYVAYCDSKFTKKKYTTTTKNAVTIKKIDGKKIDQTKNIKLYLVGYDRTGKKKNKSVVLYIAGKDNKKFTNVKSFTLSKTSVSIKQGKSTTVAVKTYKPEDTKKKELSDAHAAKFRYRSTNSKIAKVDKNGRITGVKEGKCKVFVYTRNGLARKITVTVTK